MAASDDYSVKRAVNYVNRLRLALREGQNREFNRSSDPIGDGKWQPLPDPAPFERVPVLQPFGAIVDTLNQILTEAGYGMDPSKYRLPPSEFWTLGSMTITYPIRAIYRGYVEAVLRVPIIPRVPEPLVAFLLEIPGERDLLKREHHDQVGWHYHYLDFKKARSNVVLCWDTHAVRQAGKDHPLFQETHGESHADFTARPDLWGPPKKRSMHNACAPDLDTWSLGTFRCASAKAGPVWPLSAKLTPIAKAAPPGPKFPAKKGNKGRR
jgi:hypothetical protein